MTETATDPGHNAPAPAVPNPADVPADAVAASEPTEIEQKLFEAERQLSAKLHDVMAERDALAASITDLKAKAAADLKAVEDKAAAEVQAAKDEAAALVSNLRSKLAGLEGQAAVAEATGQRVGETVFAKVEDEIAHLKAAVKAKVESAHADIMRLRDILPQAEQTIGRDIHQAFASFKGFLAQHL